MTTPLMALHERANSGDPEAVAFTAVVAALGVGEPASWPLALERLRRAADLGSDFATRQIATLTASDFLEPAPPPGEVLRLAEPRISTFSEFLPTAACDWLIGRAAGNLVQAPHHDLLTGEHRHDPARTNSAVAFTFKDFDLVIVAIRARVAAAARVPDNWLEPPQVMHYLPGQEFKPHHDFFEPNVAGFAQELARRGQRVATFLTYLNAGFEGGETGFPRLGFTCKGQAGDALMFANVDTAGAPDRRTLHAGLPPLSGEKWLFSQWIRNRPAI